jgi:sugar/nucleoside kinase (ribokinase family)
MGILYKNALREQSNHTFLRVDSLLKLEPLSFNLTNLDSEIVVISDYDKGFLSEDVIDRICQSHSNVFLDTKKKLGPWAERAKFIKINDYEYQRSLPNLSDKLLKKIIHTKGSQGCDYLGTNYTTPRVEVRDTSGAGDSFMAALVVSFLQTGDIVQSINSANLAASRVVAQRGVGVI